ncbi:alcohol dehydrogenase [Cryptococcus deuterogattii 99/473]|uniref:Alcohol dehydrogenase n=1 Tax=Cryptococcus deuterogattii Ram5 TaxID=1296110 RepID=A0A0D0V044_9TREE|nr:alcohol dehydrogenase [Cryptococcus deuterogattii LA55]KIR40846.1 alcohol dehydrogenase [Cryptococcus deuterogattii Ram5]KIR74527.1 alcohol dehydrogenase [Cryptococcus deuterogattii CA1014]KIR93984.1 alcohol dehydrogenase [Cryptococcus deuterogattii CBS 10090]KIY58482.1 alcohol dehydrogenase [Cryptococcus deuterogattii 99/473]
MSFPKTMKRYVLSHRNDLSGLNFEQDAPVPQIEKPTEILINIKALSLNARDLQIATNQYPAPHPIPDGIVPVSDASGEVVAVGDDVTDFKDEDVTLDSMNRGIGGARAGVAAEYFVCEQSEAVKIPKSFSHQDASTLAIAYSTAWSSLYSHHPRLQAGDTVLCLGTGGVSLCAAQIALISGARVILTSSSQSKLDRAVDLLKPLAKGDVADTIRTIDYSKIDKWDEEVRRITEGKGSDFVIEIGGRGTIGKSIRSTRRGGLVAVSGYLSTYKDIPKEILEEDLAQTILYSGSYVRGVFVCNREDEKRMISALEVGGVKPVIDKVFAFENLKEAYQYMADGKHFGKICITV